MERDRLIRTMQSILGPEGVISEREQLRHECDGLMNYRVIPDLVVLPERKAGAEDRQDVLRGGHPVRGEGFGDRSLRRGLARGGGDTHGHVEDAQDPRGGHPQPAGGRRARRDQRVVSQEVADEGYYYAPDPASQIVSSSAGTWRRIAAACIV